MNNTITLSLEIDTVKIEDLLCGAFEGGSNHWYEIKDYKKPSVGEKPMYLHQYPTRSGTVYISDGRADDPTITGSFPLDYVAIQKGLKVMAEKYSRHFGDFLSEDYDATTSDVFLQCCVFGEVVYG